MARARLVPRTSLPDGSVPIVIVCAPSLTAKVPVTTALAEATCLSWEPLTNAWSGSAASGLAPMNRCLNAASPPIVELNTAFQPEDTQTEPEWLHVVIGTEPSNQTASAG